VPKIFTLIKRKAENSGLSPITLMKKNYVIAAQQELSNWTKNKRIN